MYKYHAATNGNFAKIATVQGLGYRDRARAAMAEEEEIRSEVEAVQAVYGDDCLVIDEFPPHLAVHFKPRTADDSSQQVIQVVGLGFPLNFRFR